MTSKSETYKIIHRLGSPMMRGGFELEIFHYVLRPLCKGLPPRGGKLLHELYYDDMVPHFGDPDVALEHLWFGVHVIGTVSPKSLLPLLDGRTLRITNGEALYRKLLAEVALDVGSDIDNSKKLIRFIVNTGELEGVSNARDFMPPEERHPNDRAFVPYILKIFKVADDQGIIAPDDLGTLVQWLDSCNLIRLSKIIGKFDPQQEFVHQFTAPQKIPEKKSELHAQCSQEDSTGGKIVTGEVSSDGPTGSPLESYDTNMSARFQAARQESKDGPKLTKGSELAGLS